jgi:D-alanine-D-alanine ligase
MGNYCKTEEESMNRKDLRVSIICGGDAPEASVSRRNGVVIFEALSLVGYRNLKLVEYQSEGWTDIVSPRASDVAVCALEGPDGEGGILQGYLSALKIPYTGTGVAGCAVTQRKSVFKAFCQGMGIDTPPWLLVPALGPPSLERITQLGDDLFVKPNSQGSSFGLSRVRDSSSVWTAIAEAARYDDEVLIERAALGVEVTIGVIERQGRIEVLPALAVQAAEGFLSRASKAENRIDVAIATEKIDPHALEAARNAVSSLYRSLRCRGLCRVDAIFGDRCMILELNTCPGVIPGHSFVAEMLQRAGFSLGMIFDEQIQNSHRQGMAL